MPKSADRKKYDVWEFFLKSVIFSFTNKFLFKSTNIKDVIIFYLNKILKNVKVINYSPGYCFLKSAAR